MTRCAWCGERFDPVTDSDVVTDAAGQPAEMHPVCKGEYLLARGLSDRGGGRREEWWQQLLVILAFVAAALFIVWIAGKVG